MTDQKTDEAIIADHVADTFDFSSTDNEPADVVEAPEAPEVDTVDDASGDDDADSSGADAADATDDDKPKRGKSAKDRIQELVSERNAERQRTEQMQAQLQAQEQRFNAYLESQRQQPEQQQIPNFDDDPAGNIVGRQAQLEARIAEQARSQETQQAEQQQLRQTQHVVNTFNGIEQQYAQSNPDYYQRVEALKSQRAAMWVSTGMTTEQANHMVTNEAMGVIQTALSHGRNPAEAFYSMTQPQAPPATGALQRQTPSSLGSRTGGQSGPKSIRDLMKLSDADFDKATAGDNWHDLHAKEGMV